MARYIPQHLFDGLVAYRLMADLAGSNELFDDLIRKYRHAYPDEDIALVIADVAVAAGEARRLVRVVADAPGAEEDAQGEPFAGKGGQLLSRMIGACGFTREQVYLCYLVKCRGPKSRKPTAEECANCRAHFDKQFELVKPKHLVALGAFAARVLTGGTIPANKLRGTVREFRDKATGLLRSRTPILVTRRGRLAGIFFPRPEITLPIELKRELYDMLSSDVARQLKRRKVSEDDVLEDFEASRKRRRAARRRR